MSGTVTVGPPPSCRIARRSRCARSALPALGRGFRGPLSIQPLSAVVAATGRDCRLRVFRPVGVPVLRHAAVGLCSHIDGVWSPEATKMDSAGHEVEVKYRVHDHDEIERLLEVVGVQGCGDIVGQDVSHKEVTVLVLGLGVRAANTR
jgi:hypothetical protein